jgi:hypothetical protein
LAIRRKIEDEREAVRCLRAAEQAGLSAGDWARANGVDGRSLHAWEMNLARRGTSTPMKRRKKKSAPATHELIELVPAAAPIAVVPGRYALVIDGARVEFGDDVSVVTLRRVLEALRSC